MPRAPLTFEYNRSRGFLRASGNSMLNILMLVFLARRLLVYFRQGWRCRLGVREHIYTPGSMIRLFNDFFRKFEGVILEVFGTI